MARAEQGYEEAKAVLKNRPVLNYEQGVIRDIFIRLHNRRQIGMEASPIPHYEIEAHLNLFGYRDGEIRRFIAEVITQLDDNWRSPKKKEEDNG